MGRRGSETTYTLESPEVQALCDSDARLSLLIRHYGDLTYSLHTDEFSFFVETIIGQMLSNKAADAIATRLYELCGSELKPETVSTLDIQALRGIGLSGLKTDYILQMADRMIESPDYFSGFNAESDNEIIRRLTALRGIGSWTAKMYLIFVLDRLDVLPHEDGAFLQAYKWIYDTDDVRPKQIEKRCTRWSPYSSLAARYLYCALDEGLTRDAGLCEKLYEIKLKDIE
ncbi:MAG: hypothetical protein LBT32_09080 [Peptococcaceae bacterium]|jgi:DNA-3-methyladenine glycosylase II|nr:hypothetical protein [Peptococcaceae bacterium]